MSDFKNLKEASEAFDALVSRVAAAEAAIVSTDEGIDGLVPRIEAADALVGRIDEVEASVHSHTIHLTNIDGAILDLHNKVEKAPAAAAAAIMSAPADDFPATWLYASGDRSKVVNSKLEFEAATADGWVDSPDKVAA